MPAFYPQNMPRQLPLTPPDYLPYPSDSYNGPAQQFYGLSNGSRYELDGHDKYYYGKQQYYSANTSRESFHDHGHSQAPAYHAPQDNIYGNIGPPVLPPIRVPENIDLNQHHHAAVESRAAVPEPQKEEKPAGGVAAHLDYEMEQMVDFVAETAQAMYDLYDTRFCLADIDMTRSVQQSGNVLPAFRKYVSSILTSTRLPSSTIVLALHYLSTRMTMLSTSGVYSSSNAHLYHMLTTSLMLASKFLDDNTFQNRSWAEVSHIPVADLNKHELEWLQGIGWNLHIDANETGGFAGWLRQWRSYQAKKMTQSMEALKITPVDTSLRLHQSVAKFMPPTPTYTPTYSESVYGTKDRSPPYWPQWSHARTLSPPSATHSSPDTPNWYEPSVNGYAQMPSLWHGGQVPRLPLPSYNNSPYHHGYGQHYANGWGHGSNCGCGYCSAHNDRYFMGQQSYGMQTVVG